MTSNSQHTSPGAIALVGSGEYLDAMNEVDTYLLNTIGGAATAKVALLPTASGLELNGPTSWNKLGLAHFKQLGVSDIRATRIIGRDGAFDPTQLALLQGADFYYFSGGNPQHIDRDTTRLTCMGHHLNCLQSGRDSRGMQCWCHDAERTNNLDSAGHDGRASRLCRGDGCCT